MSNPIGIFLLGGPGSGKDYVLKNIFSRFDLTEVQADQILSGSANSLIENNVNIVINGALDSSKISIIKNLLENYTFDFVHVTVTNKVSRLRNEQRDNPLPENKRIQKFLAAEKLAAENNAFVFKNSINLNESSELERLFFATEIENLLKRVTEHGLNLIEEPKPKSLSEVKKATGGLKNACWDGYTAVGMKMKNGKKVPNCVPVKEEEKLPKKLRRLQRKGNISEMQLMGTDEYRKHAIAMTPGQEQNIETVLQSDCECGGDCGCNEANGYTKKDFRSLRKETVDTVDVTPTLKTKRVKSEQPSPNRLNVTMDGLPITSEEKKPQFKFMPTPQQVPAPPGGLPVPKGFKRVKDNILGTKLVPVTVKEAVEYHLENKISFTENAFRPGSEMFFEMLKEAKRLYKEGAYEPKDEWEQDLLDSDVGEFAAYEGSMVPLDYPVEEELNEEDKTDGKGIGKPWREGGGGAVYVRDGGSIRKVSFSKSGMKKKYMDPAATRSFVARHRCLTNKDKTSASYWACRWPRFFSNSGKTWW